MLVLALTALGPPGIVGAQTAAVTAYAFASGRMPTGLTLGGDSNLYGTTVSTDAAQPATVFQVPLTPSANGGVLVPANGNLAPNTLYSFTPDLTGSIPSALLWASDGDLYGAQGAAVSSGTADGSVFRISPSGSFSTIATNIQPGVDGPVSALVQASDGNLYGTTLGGGAVAGAGACPHCPSIYRVTPGGSYSLLYTFGSDLGGPITAAPLVEVPATGGGFTLYGTALGLGGSGVLGAVYEMTPSGAVSTVHAFAGGCDGTSANVLILGRDGNLYGTTPAINGTAEYGTVFELAPSGTLTTLYEFSGNDGANPSSLIEGSDGNLYGTTAQGGSGYGTVFKLARDGTLTSLYQFTGGSSDGAAPQGAVALISDPQTGAPAILYGTTSGNVGAGAGGPATIYELAGISSTSGPQSKSACYPAATSVTARASDSQVTLTWTSATLASSYNVYVGASAGGESATPVQTGVAGGTPGYGNTLSVAVPHLSNGTTYYFTIGAVNLGGNIGVSSEVEATPVGSPSSVTATAGNQQVSLTWPAAVGASSYNVYEGTSAGGEASAAVLTGITSSDGKTASATLTGLTNGTTYYFTVTGVDESGESFTVGTGSGARAYPNEASSTPTPLPAPALLTAVPADAQVVLRWSAVAGATSYDVYEDNSGTCQSMTRVETGVVATSTTLSGLIDGTTYCFEVSAVSATVESAPSNSLTAQPTFPSISPPSAPATPGGLSAEGGDDQVALSWSAVTGATSYNVYMGESAGQESTTPVAGFTGTSGTVNNLVNETTYYFKVAAVNVGGMSSESSEVSATPSAASPSTGNAGSQAGSGGNSGAGSGGRSGGGGAFDPELLTVLASILGLQRRRRESTRG